MNKNDVFETIVRHAREVVPALENHAFQPGDSLKALGANSIDRADILMMTLETLSSRVSLIELANADNIGELANIIHAQS